MASGNSTLLSPSDPVELLKRLKLLLEEKRFGNNSVIINEEIVAIVDKLLEDKCVSEKQHR